MTTKHHRIRVAVLVVAFAAGTSGVLAGNNRGDAGIGRNYGSAKIIQLGFGPGGPPSPGRS